MKKYIKFFLNDKYQKHQKLVTHECIATMPLLALEEASGRRNLETEATLALGRNAHPHFTGPLRGLNEMQLVSA